MIRLKLTCPYCDRCKIGIDDSRYSEVVFNPDTASQLPCPHLVYVVTHFHKWQVLPDGSTATAYSSGSEWKHPAVRSVDPENGLSDALCDLSRGFHREAAPDHAYDEDEFQIERMLSQAEIAAICHHAGVPVRKPESVQDYDGSCRAVFAADATAFLESLKAIGPR